MYKNIFTVILLVFSSFLMVAQNEVSSSEYIAFNSNNTTSEKYVKTPSIQNNAPTFNRYWSFGGNLGLSFWNGNTSILLGPKAYYNFSPKFLGGFGLTYMYAENKNYDYSYHSNSFGGSVMIAVRPIYFLQISAEYEGLQTNYSGYYTDEYFVNALYFGLSYVTGPVSFGIRYDVLYDTNTSIYSSAWNPYVGFYF